MLPQQRPQRRRESQQHSPMPTLLTPVQAYVQERFPPMLSLPEQDRLLDASRNNDPCDILTEATTPAKDMLRRLMQQKRTQNLEWVLWSNTVSRKRGTPLCGQAAIFTLWEDEVFLENADVSASPHWISTMLAVRSHALAMLGIAHLARLKELDSKMMEAYTRRFQQDSTLRAINNKELMAAYHEIWQDIFRRSRQEEFDVDRSIGTSLENGLLARGLAGKPSLPQSWLSPTPKGKAAPTRPRTDEKPPGPWKPPTEDKHSKRQGQGQRRQTHKTVQPHTRPAIQGSMGKGACHKFNTDGVGCSDKNCRCVHLCNARMPNGQPCGEKQPAYRHAEAKGVRT